jgi:hypothetical protein
MDVAMTGRRDVLIASVCEVAAGLAAPGSGDVRFEERRLVLALAQALGRSEFRPSLIRRGEHLANAKLVDWRPQPGRVDVAVANVENEPRYVFELRIGNIQHLVGDIFKLAAMSQLPTVEGAYAVVAATEDEWADHGDLFRAFSNNDPPSAAASSELDSRTLLDVYSESWEATVSTLKGRPRRVPAAIRLRPIGSWLVTAFAPYVLRVARMEPATSRLTEV